MHRGFTLIEMLIAMSIAAGVILGASFFIVSLAQVWMSQGNERYFETHVEGVGIFLNNVMQRSEPISDEQALPVEWQRPEGYSEFDDPLLTFNLREAPPFLVAEHGTADAGIVGHLYLDERGSGLYLVWHSRLVEPEDEDELYSTLISPLVQEITYCYYEYENDEWEDSSDPLDGENNANTYILPHFLKLKFEHDGLELEAPVYIPQESVQLPGAS